MGRGGMEGQVGPWRTRGCGPAAAHHAIWIREKPDGVPPATACSAWSCLSGCDTTSSGQTSPGGWRRRAATRRASGQAGTCSQTSSAIMGGFAESVCVPETALAPMPAGMTYEEAAALPQAGAIALQGIQDRGQVQPGQKVLINGAGGRSGMYAIQLAKLNGAGVTGVDNAERLGFMRSLGADHVIDYTRDDFTSNGRTYHLILDLAAHRPASACKGSLMPGGRYLYAGGPVATLLQVVLIGPVIGRAGQEDPAPGRPARCAAPGAHRRALPGGKARHGHRPPLPAE
ncbi:MAG TPA: hypothetical protein DHU96_05920 [Actinobacteria bacterium]|nr:hypothetical protein [Actinomycetota bacterium]